MNVEIWVMKVLPRVGLTAQETTVLQAQNKGIFRMVQAMVRCKQYPLKYVTAHK